MADIAGKEREAMKLKDGFVVRKITDSYMAVPVGKRTAEVPGVIALSESGALLWEAMQAECTEAQLTELLMKNYQVEKEQAEADVREFRATLAEQGWLDE